jgi:2-oxoglutarate dehydrogenase E2 component (dihydrolipoamide succinyltransferase)
VRKLAAEAGIDPAAVRGTGADGRVTKDDVLAHIAAAASAAPDGDAPASPSAPALRPHSVMRRRIAERMIASQMTSAHVLSVAEADMGAIVAHRAANKEAFARDGVKLSLGAYFVYVLARALRAFPDMNSSWSEEAMILHSEVNVGVAVSLGDGGLIVPVLRRADRLDLAETARGIERLAAAARDGSLGADEVRGGTFTLTNYGTTGSLIAAPIINQPQIGILGAGSIQKRPVVIEAADGTDCIAIRPMVYLSLVFDHRALDGEAGSTFLRVVKEGLEGWA